MYDRLFSLAGSQLLTLEWDKNRWGVKEAAAVARLLGTFDRLLHLDISDTEMSYDGVELVAGALEKIDTVKELKTLKWRNGRVMGKYEEVDVKLGKLECAGPYEKPGIVALISMIDQLEGLEHLDLSENFIEQSELTLFLTAMAGYKKSEEKGQEDAPPAYVKCPVLKLKSLNLSKNELGLYGASWVIKLMEIIPSLMDVTVTLTRLPEMAQGMIADAANEKGARVVF